MSIYIFFIVSCVISCWSWVKRKRRDENMLCVKSWFSFVRFYRQCVSVKLLSPNAIGGVFIPYLNTNMNSLSGSLCSMLFVMRLSQCHYIFFMTCSHTFKISSTFFLILFFVFRSFSFYFISLNSYQLALVDRLINKFAFDILSVSFILILFVVRRSSLVQKEKKAKNSTRNVETILCCICSLLDAGKYFAIVCRWFCLFWIFEYQVNANDFIVHLPTKKCAVFLLVYVAFIQFCGWTTNVSFSFRLCSLVLFVKHRPLRIHGLPFSMRPTKHLFHCAKHFWIWMTWKVIKNWLTKFKIKSKHSEMTCKRIWENLPMKWVWTELSFISCNRSIIFGHIWSIEWVNAHSFWPFNFRINAWSHVEFKSINHFHS